MWPNRSVAGINVDEDVRMPQWGLSERFDAASNIVAVEAVGLNVYACRSVASSTPLFSLDGY